MICLERDNGDTVLINPDQVVQVEPINSGTKTRITLRNGYLDVEGVGRHCRRAHQWPQPSQ